MAKTHRSRPASEPALQRLAAWSARKPRIALMGEFSSGKSTLLNLLIGEDFLPTRVTATELPPVWFSHGAPRAYWVDRQDRRHPIGFGAWGGIPRSARYIRIFAPAAYLERCDVIDTPGISDPNLEDESWRFPVGQADFILWCTPATQAWRETERSTWASLPERLRAQSLLVVTRADKIDLFDREKVARRLSRESAGLFQGLMFLSSVDALKGRAEIEESGDATLWEGSGAIELMERVDAGLAAVRAARQERLGFFRSADFAAPPVEEPAPLRLVTAPEPVRPRRVELPEHRRSERPAPEAAAAPAPDPLDEIRSGWRALRAAEPQPEPAPVLRLGDPLPRAEPPLVLAQPKPLILDQPVPAAPEPLPPLVLEQPEPLILRQPAPLVLDQPLPTAEEPLAEEPAAEALPAVAEAAEEATAEPVPPHLPRAVRIWRDIVARSTETPPNSPLVAMIDQLLFELSREDELSDETGLSSATIIERNQAA